MHDPCSVAFEIHSPFIKRGSKSPMFPKGDRAIWLVVWHKDPCRDGSDDSCGRFMRARHGDPVVLKAIESIFAFNWDADWGGWFDKTGYPRISTPGLVLQMFQMAVWEHFKQDRRKRDRFLKRNLIHILSFAENTVDSLHSSIVGKYGFQPRKERIEHFASVVYGCILRWDRPWYRNPVLHVHHWRLQCPSLQALWRWRERREKVALRRGMEVPTP